MKNRQNAANKRRSPVLLFVVVHANNNRVCKVNMKTNTIYLIGIFLVGLTQDWLRNVVGNLIFLPAIFLYLVVLVFVAQKYGKNL